MTLEAVCILLGEKSAPDWAGIRKLLMDTSFIPSVVNFDRSAPSPSRNDGFCTAIIMA
jgi:hypothetical protein